MDQGEHRGWEIENDYTPHPVDDPDVDIAAGADSSLRWFTANLVICVGAVLLWHAITVYWTPPAVYFPAPAQALPADWLVFTFPNLPRGWRADCLWMDGNRKLARPNYDNPECNKQAAQQRGSY